MAEVMSRHKTSFVLRGSCPALLETSLPNISTEKKAHRDCESFRRWSTRAVTGRAPVLP